MGSPRNGMTAPHSGNGQVIPFQQPDSDDGEQPPSVEGRLGRVEDGLVRIEARLDVQHGRLEALTDLALTRITASAQQATGAIVTASQQAQSQMGRRVVVPVGVVTAIVGLLQFMIAHWWGR